MNGFDRPFESAVCSAVKVRDHKPSLLPVLNIYESRRVSRWGSL